MELIIDKRKIFGSIDAEQTKKMNSLCSDSSFAEKDFLDVLNLFNRNDPSIKTSLDYAKTLDFSKNHLRSSYLSHPIRLATFLVLIDPQIDTDYIIIALLHNVPETTEVTIEELRQRFGTVVAEGIAKLVIDRKAIFSDIKPKYYKDLFDAGTYLVLVKLIDKMDNLFVLCLNPDNEVRKNYIAEIRQELLPFAKQFNNNLGDYLDKLLTSAELSGFSKKLKDQLTEYQQNQINKS